MTGISLEVKKAAQQFSSELSEGKRLFTLRSVQIVSSIRLHIPSVSACQQAQRALYTESYSKNVSQHLLLVSSAAVNETAALKPV